MTPIFLSKHFSFGEVTRSATAARLGIENIPPDDVLDNLIRLCLTCLEPVRVLAGGPLILHSGYRCYALNKAVGGSPSSYHLVGCAADFDPPPGMTHDALQHLIAASDIPFDKVIEERAGDGAHWLHLQCARPGETPRRVILDAALAVQGGPITRISAG
jgi:zinc D-Ala-D-Ala carboxypeptidase